MASVFTEKEVMVPWKAAALLRWIATEILWNKNAFSRCSVILDNFSAISERKLVPSLQIGPSVSTATGIKWCVPAVASPGFRGWGGKLGRILFFFPPSSLTGVGGYPQQKLNGFARISQTVLARMGGGELPPFAPRGDATACQRCSNIFSASYPPRFVCSSAAREGRPPEDPG